MAAINPEQKAVLDIAHSYYRETQGEAYSFYIEQLQWNGIANPQPLVNTLLADGLLQQCGPRYRISDAGINAIEADAINSLEA